MNKNFVLDFIFCEIYYEGHLAPDNLFFVNYNFCEN